MRARIIPVTPGPGQESAWDYPRPPRVEPSTERIRIVLGGEVLVDTTDSVRVSAGATGTIASRWDYKVNYGHSESHTTTDLVDAALDRAATASACRDMAA